MKPFRKVETSRGYCLFMILTPSHPPTPTPSWGCWTGHTFRGTRTMPYPHREREREREHEVQGSSEFCVEIEGKVIFEQQRQRARERRRPKVDRRACGCCLSLVLCIRIWQRH